MKWSGRKPRRKDGTPPEPAKKKREWGKLIPLWLGAVAAAIAIVVAGYKFAVHLEGEPQIEVELAEATVSNPPANIGLPAESEPTVTATVRNRGSHTAWVKEARITVDDSARIGVCFTQGGGPDVPHSKPYRVTMPEFPTTGKRVLHRQLHVEVQPGHGVRPLLKFQKRLQSTTGLYAIDVSYVVDPGEEVLDAGRFVIGVPGPLDRSDYYLPEEEAALMGRNFWHGVEEIPTEVAWCLRHNLAAVRRLAADPGARSAEVAALSDVRPAPAWSQVIARESPREAVSALLESEDSDAPLYAIDAAAATGDKAYEAEVRKRVVAALDARVKADLQHAGSLDIEAAEGAVAIEPSAAGRELLAAVKNAVTVAEERRRTEAEAEASTVASR